MNGSRTVSPVNLHCKTETQTRSDVCSLNFKSGLIKHAPVDSRTYVSSIAQNEQDRLTQEAQTNFFKSDNSPNFKIQMANGRLEQPLATTTRKFDFADNNFK